MIENRIRVRCDRCNAWLFPPPGPPEDRNGDTFDKIESAQHEASNRGWTIGEADGDDAYCDVCVGPELEDDGIDYSVVRTSPTGGDGAK